MCCGWVWGGARGNALRAAAAAAAAKQNKKQPARAQPRKKHSQCNKKNGRSTARTNAAAAVALALRCAAGGEQAEAPAPAASGADAVSCCDGCRLHTAVLVTASAMGESRKARRSAEADEGAGPSEEDIACFCWACVGLRRRASSSLARKEERRRRRGLSSLLCGKGEGGCPLFEGARAGG